MEIRKDGGTERQRKRQTWPNRRDRKMEKQRDRHSVTEGLKDIGTEQRGREREKKYRQSKTKSQKDRVKVKCRDREVGRQRDRHSESERQKDRVK